MAFAEARSPRDDGVIETLLGRIAAGEDLSLDDMATTLGHVMEGRCSPGEIALLLTGLHMKGETAEELAGAATAMRRCMTPLRTTRQGLLDTCGTGGSGSGKFNVSTASAIVAAAAGVPVAKHGNRRVTGKSGSADVLAALGVNVEADRQHVEVCLDQLGICFCFAPLWHTAMKQVAAVRRELGFSTIFNMLGPLANPASASYQLVGVARSEALPLMAEALAMLGAQRAVVVSGTDGLDEVTIAGTTEAVLVGQQPPKPFRWQPADFGLQPASSESLVVAGPEDSAQMIRRVLAGEKGPPRDMVVLNAAAALWTAEKAGTPRECAQLAIAAIDSRQAAELLERLVELSHA